MVSSEQLETISKGFVPKNTEKNTKWAVSTFKHETSVALWARLEMSTSSQSQWTKTVNTLNFAVFCVFLLLKPTKPTVTRIHTSSTTRNTSVVPSTLFGSARNCTINVQVFNQASIQNFQGMSTSVTVAVDADNDTFLDSVLASSNLQLRSRIFCVTFSLLLFFCFVLFSFVTCVFVS